MSPRRRIVALLALVPAVVPGAAHAQGPDASVVRVLCTTPVRAVTGSGLVVGARSVLTSQRVVACAGEGGRVSIGVGAGAVLAGTVDWSAPSRDLALVTTASAHGRPLPVLAQRAVADGAEVQAVGFPGPGTLDAPDRLREAAFVASILPGVVTRTRRADGALVHDTDAALTPGLRGAPLLNVCGEVAGLVGEDDGAAGVRLRVVGRDAVADAVQSRRLDLPVAARPCAATAAGGAPADAAPVPPASDAAIPAWLWAVALGLLLAGLLPILARGRRRSSTEPTPELPPSPPVPVPPTAVTPRRAGWRLTGLSGLLAETDLAVRERIRIGRDPATCELVVPEQASAVSKRHAVVWVDAGEVWIQDASSNGTFVNGRRLERNRPERLRDGDTVTFATPDVGVRLSAA